MKKLVLISFLVICCLEVKAQGPNITPPSADASALGKYGTYPTDLAHGLVNINIPLYTIKTKQLEVPISLSYHASGIRVNDISSWVGLEWVLNAGGVLTRSVRGRSDESGGYASASNVYKTQAQINAITDVATLYNYLNDRATGATDAESDMYSYNANGLSGSFVYGSNQQIIQLPFTNNKIIANTPGSSYTIVSDDGTVYTFDVGEVTQSSGSPESVNTAFYLSKITSADGSDVIYFDYVNSGGGYYDVSPSTTITDNGSFDIISSYPTITTPTSKYLSKIRFSNGYVNFITAADRKDKRKYRLAKIQVYSADNVLKRTINMNQDYFVSTTPAPTVQNDPNANIAYRMKLTGVDIQDATATTVQSYSFNYNTSVTLPPFWGGGAVPNPNYYYGQDLYGYYNGVTGNTYLLNVVPPEYPGLHAADRHIDPVNAQAGVLTEIVYPTKGSTKFIYESNTTTSQTVGLIGGLRIKEIDNYINNDAVLVGRKTFSYSGGNTQGSPWYLSFFYNCVYNQFVLTNGGANGSVVNYYTSSPMFPLNYGSNNGIFYPYVTEMDLANDGTALGKTDYQYEYEDDILYTSAISLPTTTPSQIYSRYGATGGLSSSYIEDMSWARGPLKSEVVSKRNTDGSFTVVKSIVNDYTNFLEHDNYTGENIFPSVTNTQGPGADVPTVKQWFQFFDILTRSGIKKLTSSVETTDGVAKSTNYFYDNTANMYLTRRETIDSKGLNIKTVSKYPQDKSAMSNLSTTAASSIDMMVSRNMLNNIIESDVFYNGSLSSINRTDYNLYTPGSNTLILPNFITSSTASNPLEQRVVFNAYDDQGNVQNLSKVNGPQICYIWGYGGIYPVAKVENASYTSVQAALGGSTAVESFKNLTNPTDASVNSFLAPLRAISNTLVTTYTYTPLVGMTSSTDAKGETTYYEYDNFQRLLNIKDKDGNVIKHMSYHYQGQ